MAEFQYICDKFQEKFKEKYRINSVFHSNAIYVTMGE